MLLRYKTLKKKSRIFKKLTGHTLKQFAVLSARLKIVAAQLSSPLGRKAKLDSLEDKLLALLIYYRTYISYEFLGFLIGLDQSNLCRLFKKLEPMMARRVSIKKDRTLRAEQVEQLLIDATEQAIQRPKKSSQRKRTYSGKKKRHSLKIECVMTPEGQIKALSKSYPGCVHDLTIRRWSDPLPQEAIKRVDLGYLGLDQEMSHVLLPHKRRQQTVLSLGQRLYSKAHGSIRILIEHKFAQLKKFKILGEVYRNSMKRHHLRWNIIAGLVNMQCGF